MKLNRDQLIDRVAAEIGYVENGWLRAARRAVDARSDDQKAYWVRAQEEWLDRQDRLLDELDVLCEGRQNAVAVIVGVYDGFRLGGRDAEAQVLRPGWQRVVAAAVRERLGLPAVEWQDAAVGSYDDSGVDELMVERTVSVFDRAGDVLVSDNTFGGL